MTNRQETGDGRREAAWAPPPASRLSFLALFLSLAACAHPQPLTLGGEPELRIGLNTGLTLVRLGGDGELFLADDANGKPVGAIPAGVTWSLIPDSGGGLVLVKPGGSRTERHLGLSAVNVTEGRFAMVNGRRYRGRLNVYRTTAGLTVMNRVPLEGYVAGVLGQEMGPRRDDERQALLAQTIVSRTFAVRNRGRWESEGFDAWADTRDQVYPGVAGESPQAWEAVRATAGQVIEYHGAVIDAYFHSTCGGKTAAPEEAFRTVARPSYLKPVSDASGGGHSYCDISPRWQWREEWDGQTLRTILTRTLAQVMTVPGDGLPPITGVEVAHTTESGRVDELRIVFSHGDVRVGAADVRSVLRPQPDRLLQSTVFSVDVSKTGGVVSRLVVEGHGSGHGVGMCQWGAIGRARAGQNYEKILSTYYPGTTVERLY
ncbi:MAG TPA: SpoIID/LytB domain-containing protein [Gemmatimonadales bacterium]|nr:SpoIID/LytB domain-containing protein [Gemmatimonadales bacterium]